MHFLLISENDFTHEIKRDGMTSFMHFMNRSYLCLSGLKLKAFLKGFLQEGRFSKDSNKVMFLGHVFLGRKVLVDLAQIIS